MKSVFAETLGGLRREKRLSQRQAAADLGISQALLSHYENDAREPKLEFVVRACNYYNVPADFILGRSKERGPGAAKITEVVGEIVGSLEDMRTTEASLIEKLKQLTSG